MKPVSLAAARMAAVTCDLHHILIGRIAAMVAAVIVVVGNCTAAPRMITPVVVVCHLIVSLWSFKFCRLAIQSIINDAKEADNEIVLRT
jgi:hypothetical protein